MISQILYFAKEIENWGSGIKRIHNICKENGIEVEFKILKSGFAVVFYRPGFEKENSISEFGSDATITENNLSNDGINVGINDGINDGINETQKKFYHY